MEESFIEETKKDIDKTFHKKLDEYMRRQRESNTDHARKSNFKQFINRLCGWIKATKENKGSSSKILKILVNRAMSILKYKQF